MKRILSSIVLIFVMLGPFAGTYSWLQYQKKAVKRSVKKQIIAGINENQLYHLSFTIAESKTELRWEHKHEFEYQGHMYDIVRQELRNDSVFYICWLDKEETVLNIKLMSIVNRNLSNNPQNQKKQAQLNNFFKSLICEEKHEYNFALTYEIKVVYCEKALKLESLNLFPPSPPPQNI